MPASPHHSQVVTRCGRRLWLFESVLTLVLFGVAPSPGLAAPPDLVLTRSAATQPLALNQPLDAEIRERLTRFCLQELTSSADRREQLWRNRLAEPPVVGQQLAEARARLRALLGTSEPRQTQQPTETEFEFLATPTQPSQVTRLGEIAVHAVRWPVWNQVWGEGLLVLPPDPKAGVVALPDADVSPEQLLGWEPTAPVRDLRGFSRLLWDLASRGCAIVIPTLISRDSTWAGHPRVGFTNQSHREFLYRQAFVVGRHPLGWEVAQTQSALDLLSRLISPRPPASDGPAVLGVAGWGEGGRVALLTAAVDDRVRGTLVSGAFSARETLWQEPLDRNVWRLLTEFGDAELILLASPHPVVIEACQSPEWQPVSQPGQRLTAAPGRLQTPPLVAVTSEFARARTLCEVLPDTPAPIWISSGPEGHGPPGSEAARSAFFATLSLPQPQRPGVPWPVSQTPLPPSALRSPMARQRRLCESLQAELQRLLVASHQVRDSLWRPTPASVAEWLPRRRQLVERVHNELIGRLELPTTPPAPRSRVVHETDRYLAQEVLLDVGPDLLAGGILLLPKSLRPGERRPVVVCQHGLEGLASDTFSREPNAFKYYRAFAESLVHRGYIVYSPQNPYRGEQSFRVLQRMLNPLGRSLFSVIIEQHRQTLEWLATLPWVDPQRMGFYGLSYGGKTAVRVPPFVERYALSICSGDFTDWVRTIAANDETFSYLFTPEYEVYEWNAAHLASHAELALLMAPRPFMVEEGHRDGGQPSEWVAGEFGKVRRFYDQLQLPERAELEFFDGPHQIQGVGTFRFLDRQLDWSPPAERPGPN